MRKIQKITGRKKKSSAVPQALSDFLRQQRKNRLITRALAGQTDYSLTNDELEARDTDETHPQGRRRKAKDGRL